MANCHMSIFATNEGQFVLQGFIVLSLRDDLKLPLGNDAEWTFYLMDGGGERVKDCLILQEVQYH